MNLIRGHNSLVIIRAQTKFVFDRMLLYKKDAFLLILNLYKGANTLSFFHLFFIFFSMIFVKKIVYSGLNVKKCLSCYFLLS